MKILNRCISFLLALCFVYGCFNGNKTKVVIYTKAPIGSKLYIKSVAFLDEPEHIVDSATVVNNHDSLILHVQHTQDQLFKIVVKDNTRLQFIFVNDAKLIRVHADYFADTSSVSGSAATTSLKSFNANQLNVAVKMRALNKTLDSLKQLHVTGKQLGIATGKHDSIVDVYFKNYVRYDDTVKSPAVFVQVYNAIDFGNDYKGFGEFINRNTKRFAWYKPMAQIKKEAMDVIRIHEQDFKVGDALPSITLPDVSNKPFNTASLKGQYYLIDFWATYCPQCGAFKLAEKKLDSAGNASNVKLVSVAMDDDYNNWRAAVVKTKMNWVNLIDRKMWTGTAVNTLLFDSIPFNFLVNPRGKVIATAIKPDSLAKVLGRLVKK